MYQHYPKTDIQTRSGIVIHLTGHLTEGIHAQIVRLVKRYKRVMFKGKVVSKRVLVELLVQELKRISSATFTFK